MNGTVDEQDRALLEIEIACNFNGPTTPITTWIDTAFDGHLILSRSQIDRVGLNSLAETEAILADGTTVQLETYLCYVDWFGKQLPVQVIANEGKFPLLGTGLLEGKVLLVNYVLRELRLD